MATEVVIGHLAIHNEPLSYDRNYNMDCLACYGQRTFLVTSMPLPHRCKTDIDVRSEFGDNTQAKYIIDILLSATAVPPS